MLKIAVQKGIPVPAATKIGRSNPEYDQIAADLKSLAIGDSFVVTKEEAVKIRYVASESKADVPLTSRTVGDQVGFWRIAERPVRVVKPKAPVAKTATAETGSHTQADEVGSSADE